MRIHRIRVIALLLGIIFLGAQFHLCAEARPARAPSSHVCPICLSGAWALPAHSPDVSVVPVERWIEVAASPGAPSMTMALTVVPRAPPLA